MRPNNSTHALKKGLSTTSSRSMRTINNSYQVDNCLQY